MKNHFPDAQPAIRGTRSLGEKVTKLTSQLLSFLPLAINVNDLQAQRRVRHAFAIYPPLLDTVRLDHSRHVIVSMLFAIFPPFLNDKRINRNNPALFSIDFFPSHACPLRANHSRLVTVSMPLAIFPPF
jgi:hypothetical protein